MKLSQHHASEIVKLLLVGHSGGGKTGALASLINAGYKLHIADFDNGCDILHQFVDHDKRDSVYIETLTDKMTMAASGQAIPFGEPKAYMNFVGLLKNWKDSVTGEEFGSISTWKEDRILVIDSMTLLGTAIMHHVKFLNSALLERDWGFYGPAMELEEKLFELLYSQQVQCNVIVNAHIISVSEKQKKMNEKGKEVTVEVGDPKAFPSALGNKLPPKIGRFFNAVLQAKSMGSSRWIETQYSDDIELKNPAPKSVPARLELGTGLAKYFDIVKRVAKGETPTQTPTKPTNTL